MAEGLQKGKQLLIISDTAMWRTPQGISVFEPALREVEYLSSIFERITWIGFNYGLTPLKNTKHSSISNIDYILLPKAFGGSSIISKLRIIKFLPKQLIIILSQIRIHKFIHTRGPSVPALIAILVSYLLHHKKFWHKYAGNWVQKDSAWAYALQRYLLKHVNHKITVNGNWGEKNENIISFENPTFSITEVAVAKAVGIEKNFNSRISILFVGNLETTKGVHLVVQSIKNFSSDAIEKLVIVGDGTLRTVLKQEATKSLIPIVFTGHLNRMQLNELYSMCHIFVFPSFSEGFPKVLAEACAFGCVPVTSNVSSIDQYINDSNGVLLKENTVDEITNNINKLLGNRNLLKRLSLEALKVAPKFTFERYVLRVEQDIFQL